MKCEYEVNKMTNSQKNNKIHLLSETKNFKLVAWNLARIVNKENYFWNIVEESGETCTFY